MVINKDVLEDGFVNVIYPNEDEERNKKALEEECRVLKHHVEELTEIIAVKDISLSLYKDEKEYIMSTSKRLNEVVLATMKNTISIDLIKEISFPQTGNEFKDSCAKVFDAVIKSVQQLKHDLTESKNVIEAKCKSIAIWTDQQNADANSMQKTFEKELYEKKSKLALYNDEARRNEIKIKELQSSNDDLRNQCGKLQQQAFDLQKSLERERQQPYLVQENAELKTRLKQIDKWIKQQNYNTDNYTSTIEQLHLQLSKIGKDLQSVKSEKDDLQTRLSSMAGERLTKGNPSITDLGDPNRPMKIGEKYGELYDNEWTDAMESVESIQNCFPGLKNAEQEEIVIHHMYRLLMEDELFTLPGCKEVQIYRRQNSEGFANYLVKSQIICKDVLENWDYGHKSEIVLQELITTPFFHKCVHICWCMAIQDPLMYLAEHLPPDTKFDKNEYKEFVKSGDKVKFMVWPALYLHKDGPLLHKGVVQAYW
ncbi:Hypothetical predicted protein [Mytilus galloprovincialis]|uniref:Mitochondria-eating protein C-terminal domain-containing protein n=1 Tax=Mytilus galloprovincialis TaxID=29158 RepID=A0A8B6FEG9_MYTGA|nr:Hypothetical predicted protein [Mytilus galloprovincialis]